MSYQPTVYRVTKPMRRVLQAFLDLPPGRSLYGYEVSQLVGLGSGSLYPMLRRLEDAGWLQRENLSVAFVHGRPPRVYYRLTNLGRHHAERIAPPPPIETLLESV